MIAAGLIYLALPLSKAELIHRSSLKNKFIIDNILYRINDSSIETSKGIYLIDINTKWVLGEEEVKKGKARFLGQNVWIQCNDEGVVKEIVADSNLNVPEKIRVILSMDSSGNQYVHSNIAISCNDEFWSVQDGMIQTYSSKEEITADVLEKRTVFIPAKEGTPLKITTPNGTKEYLGILEVTPEKNGYSVVNEVTLENYIKGVVPAEMPSSYGVEAAKVQAVCARNYVYNQWYGTEKFACWGAQVDDSVKSQVYGGNINNSICIQGVEETWGEFLTYEGTPIATNYFSTSCGYTANGSEVWGGSEAVYQKGSRQYIEEEAYDLSTEEGFYAFITDYKLNAYDSHSPWFRWSVEITIEQIQNRIEKYLEGSPKVKVIDGDTLVETMKVEVGNFSDIFVYERSQTGMAVSLLIVGDKKSIVIEGPNEIRKLLGDVSVILMNGESAGERELLPSAFIIFEKIKDSKEELMAIKIWGGGYGHGVGMSQNGVKGMIDAGFGYQDILKHYFKDTELTILY